MYSDFASVLESYEIEDRKYQLLFSKDDQFDKSKISEKRKELANLPAVDVVKLLVSKIKKELSNSPETNKWMCESVYKENLKNYKKSGYITKLETILGFKCVIAIDKNGKLFECLVPPNHEMADLFDLTQIATVLLYYK